MGDNIQPNKYHAVATPSAEHLSDAAADGSAPSVGTPPSRGNSPAANGSEGTNANPGVLQVIPSPGAARDETWNSFLDRHFAEGKISKTFSTSSEPSNLSTVSRQINAILEAADGFVSSEAGLALQDAQSIPLTPEQPPQPSIDLQSPMAGPTPLPRAQTHSFVFTSSRQCTNLRDKNVIGVVAAGGRASTNNVFPNTLPATGLSTSKAAVLTPEQVRVHSLCAKHAIPAHSPFVQFARNRSNSTVVSPLQNPFSLLDRDPPDRSSHRKGIDFYMDAARVAKTRPSKGSLIQPVTPSPQHPTHVPFSSTNPTSSNTLMTFPKRPPNILYASSERLPAVAESPTPPTSPSISDTSSKRKKRSRSKTRKERACSDGKPEQPRFPKARYTKYLEHDPDRPSFISCSSTTRDASTSSYSSSSSGKSMASLDESITSMSAFGVLGSGNAESVFGSAVVKQPPKRLGSDRRRTPSSIVLDG